jgi:hypothetical protein
MGRGCRRPGATPGPQPPPVRSPGAWLDPSRSKVDAPGTEPYRIGLLPRISTAHDELTARSGGLHRGRGPRHHEFSTFSRSGAQRFSLSQHRNRMRIRAGVQSGGAWSRKRPLLRGLGGTMPSKSGLARRPPPRTPGTPPTPPRRPPDAPPTRRGFAGSPQRPTRFDPLPTRERRPPLRPRHEAAVRAARGGPEGPAPSMSVGGEPVLPGPLVILSRPAASTTPPARASPARSRRSRPLPGPTWRPNGRG